MNAREFDVLKVLLCGDTANQRVLADKTGQSLGKVNKCLRELKGAGFLNEDGRPSLKALELAESRKPKNAIILAAGYGMRMVPINTETPKGLLEIRGEILVERTIKQLRQAGIEEIVLVAGFMKEWYEYLCEDYGVKIISNSEYAEKNNLHSLALAIEYLDNSYIIPCDIWCKDNPYSSNELYSWYMVGDWTSADSTVRVNRRRELVNVQENEDGNAMIGICYICGDEATRLKARLVQMDLDRRYKRQYWETALQGKNGLSIAAKLVFQGDAVEINTYEQLRELDSNSNNLKTDSLELICSVLGAKLEDITDIQVLKKGMTNRSFLFCHKGKKYIMRIPGEGTDRLIDRAHEAAVYKVIAEEQLCDNVIYINAENGYKISEFIEGARVCRPEDPEDVKKCMAHLRCMHGRKLQIGHDFDIYAQIDFYESLREGRSSAYRDYYKTKDLVMSLKAYVDSLPNEHVLTHIDAVPDNFLFFKGEDGNEKIRLIDWEYSGMQDPHVDIAMFGIYSMYDRGQMDNLISEYFTKGCDSHTRYKIYAYIAACGLLWSNWCEYKMMLGIDFGEYSIRQYAYAREYAKLACEKVFGGKE